VDSKSRQVAAEVLEKFRDGVITNFEFEGLWPQNYGGDRGLRAIETMVWRYYDDLHEHKLTNEHGLTELAHLIFDRCVLFLRTECEYAWPDDNFAQGEAFSGTLTTLGLSDAPDWFEEARLKELHVVEESASWPFSSRPEYERAQTRS